MTGETLRGELTSVRVGVARQAFARESEIGVPCKEIPISQHVSGFDMIPRVALRALQRLVLALKHISGRRMVKTFCVKAYQGERPSVMFIVALRAYLQCQACMVPIPGRNAGPKFGVTRETILVRHGFLSERMALGAILDPLQCGMGR